MVTGIIAVHADTHPGSTMGLCPPEFERAKNLGTYYANSFQLFSWSKWMEYWDEVERLKKVYPNATVYSISNGDAADDNSHETWERVSHNPYDIKKISVKVYERSKEIADHLFFIQGTSAHVGQLGYLEMFLAEELGAEPDYQENSMVWSYLRADMGGALVEAYHHPQTVGRMPHTENSAASRQSMIVFNRCHECGDEVPDLCFYSHVHYFADSGIAKKPRVIYTPSWQLPYDYIHRIGKGQFPPAIGGIIALVGEERPRVIPMMARPQRKQIWRPLQSKS